ncbi:MAG: hypothetical protein IPP81_19255 [Chitinophagaceae bacterium]|nr:hypothetical protein [Chitinophagaceae bacterium]
MNELFKLTEDDSNIKATQKGDKISLYLDYYGDGKRDYEYLQLYIIPEPEKGEAHQRAEGREP